MKDKYYDKSGRKSGSPEPNSCILLAKPCLSKKTFKIKFTQDHCGEGGLVLIFVHSCRPDASLHMYLSVGRPLWWDSVQGTQGHLQQQIEKAREGKPLCSTSYFHTQISLLSLLCTLCRSIMWVMRIVGKNPHNCFRSHQTRGPCKLVSVEGYSLLLFKTGRWILSFSGVDTHIRDCACNTSVQIHLFKDPLYEYIDPHNELCCEALLMKDVASRHTLCTHKAHVSNVLLQMHFEWIITHLENWETLRLPSQVSNQQPLEETVITILKS